MLGKGRQPAGYQVRDRKGRRAGVTQCCKPGRDTETDSRDRIHFRQRNGQCLKIREGGY